MTISLSEETQPFSGACATHVPTNSTSRAVDTQRELPERLTTSLAELFKLLADETRLRILFLLQQRQELNVRSLCHLLSQSQPAVSHHLALLRGAGLIEMRRDGKHNFYRIVPKRFEEFMGMMFAVSAGDGNQIRFDDYVLSFSQAVQDQ
jgi:ArsR family transcriptional regulator